MYPGAAYSGLFRADAFSLFVHWIVCGVAFLAILGSTSYLKREDLDAGEFCALILFATAGMGVMAGAQELLTAFIGLEMSSISSYILASYKRDAPRSNEAAMKYFLLGSFATAFFLYGIALSFGATGSTHLDLMTPLANDSAHDAAEDRPRVYLRRAGVQSRRGPVPALDAGRVRRRARAGDGAAFHRPQGRRIRPGAAHSGKRRGRGARSGSGRSGLPPCSACSREIWRRIVQTSLKRMLAYSSIAHAGYILVALAAAAATDHPEAGIAAALFYLVGYALVKLGAFLIVAQLGGAGERHVEIDDFTGLARRQPAMAACLSLFLLSLLGLPITAGFLGNSTSSTRRWNRTWSGSPSCWA